MGNPLDEHSDEITILDTKEVMSEEVARSIMCAHEEGKKQHSENLDAPSFLSKNGKLRSGQKSDLVSCLQTDSPPDFGEADVKLIDGANMVHALGSDRSIKKFHDYAENKVIPFI